MSKTRVFALGDIHGDFKPIRAFSVWTENNVNKNDKIVLILLGDVGANFFFNDRDKEFKERLGEYNIEYFAIRGNHEERPSVCARNNPKDWEKQLYFGQNVWVEKEFPHIKYALDEPAVYRINGHLTFVIPGAYSVDKYVRLKRGTGWFAGEQLTNAEMQRGMRLAENIEKCDLILSHTCPVCYEPTDLFLSNVDQSMVDKTMERYLGEIETKLKYKLWLWGHYHQTRVYPEFNGTDRVMLTNDKIIDIDEYFKTKDPYSSMHYVYF